MKDRSKEEKIAVTRISIGTDVNFGAITCGMIEDLEDKKEYVVTADFLFIGAGGGAITLLKKTDIPEGRGYGGFPISGQWLKCTNDEVIAQHEAKVYGKAATGSPPMSVTP